MIWIAKNRQWYALKQTMMSTIMVNHSVGCLVDHFLWLNPRDLYLSWKMGNSRNNMSSRNMWRHSPVFHRKARRALHILKIQKKSSSSAVVLFETIMSPINGARSRLSIICLLEVSITRTSLQNGLLTISVLFQLRANKPLLILGIVFQTKRSNLDLIIRWLKESSMSSLGKVCNGLLSRRNATW